MARTGATNRHRYCDPRRLGFRPTPNEPPSPVRFAKSSAPPPDFAQTSPPPQDVPPHWVRFAKSPSPLPEFAPTSPESERTPNRVRFVKLPMQRRITRQPRRHTRTPRQIGFVLQNRPRRHRISRRPPRRARTRRRIGFVL